MSEDRVFLDTALVLALANRQDRYFHRAQSLFAEMRQAQEVWVTEAVLTEIGNGLARGQRPRAGAFIEMCYHTSNIHVVSVDTGVMQRALALYRSRQDKHWGMTDCISFVVMEEHGLQAALTNDQHFVQAGFRALLLED